MAGLCKVMIIGHLGRDPEMRFTPNGVAVTSFSVASSRTYTAGGERKEETEWFRVSAWNKLAEFCSQYLRKGSKIYVEGRLSTSTWDGTDGQKRTTLEVRAAEVLMLDSKPRGEGSEPGDDQGGAEMGGHDLDTIPF